VFVSGIITGNNITAQNIYGNIVANNITAENIYGNLTANSWTPGNVTNFNVTGNVTAGYFVGNGSQLTGTFVLPAVANVDIGGNVIGAYANVNQIVAISGNIGNVRIAGGNIALDGQVNAIGNVVAGYFIGNGSQLTGMFVLPVVSNTDVSGNLVGAYANVANIVAVRGNVGNLRFLGGNIAASGQVNVLGNVVAGYFVGNGSQLTGMYVLPAVASIDINGNHIGAYANVTTVIATSGNIGNVNITGGNITSSGSIKATCYQTGAVEVANLTSIDTSFRGTLLKGYIAAGGYAAQQFISCANGNVGTVFRVRGDGVVYANVYLTSGADYAEYFEWADGNPANEDRRGMSTVLNDAGMIRLSAPADDPYDVFGVISSNPGFIGDAAEERWGNKYLKDQFGNKLSNVVYYLSNISDETDRTRCTVDTVAPEGYAKTWEDEWILNSAYDPSVPYVSRENRPEWAMVGLVGKLIVLQGQVVNPNWKLMKHIVTTVGNADQYLLSTALGVNVRSIMSELAAIKAHVGL
jgi:hypothetical protein